MVFSITSSIMWMKYIGKKSASVLGMALMAGVLLLPVHDAVSVPVPLKKPDLSMQDLRARMDLFPTMAETERAGAAVEKVSVAMQKAGHTFKGLVAGATDYKEKYGAILTGGDLSARDVETYHMIFDLQAHGKMDEADAYIARLSDKGLMGHVLYQRYMHPVAYRSTYGELKSWLESYADHPGAEKIYKLALARTPEGVKGALPHPQENGKVARVGNPKIQRARTYASTISRTSEQKRDIIRFSRNVRDLVRTGQADDALTLFGQAPERALMDAVELDRLQAQIAAGYLYAGKLDVALALAMQSADRSGLNAPTAGWVAGLAAWQRQDYASAARYFAMTGRSPYVSGWMASAGSYWAARAHGKLGDRKSRTAWLRHAAKQDRTFYGLLAVQALGRAFDFNWSSPAFGEEQEQMIRDSQAGRRAMALVAAGRNEMAEAELMRLEYAGNDPLREAVLAYANKVGLPAVAMRLGQVTRLADGRYSDSAIYPLSPWSPEGGYAVDPALVHAVVRQESRFDMNAESHRGAMGLMQVMPETASYVMRDMSYAAGREGEVSLRMPDVNLEVGQSYLAYLLKNRLVKGDMVALLVAYNAGPGNLQRWRKERPTDDPLLFIETIPVGETRDYVERVLSNYWIYRLRGREDTPTLAALSSGKSAQYAQILLDDGLKLAANE